MTTVAWDGEVLAADCQANLGCLRRSCRKIFDCGKYWYAGCGTLDALQIIAEWLRTGALRQYAPDLEDGGGWGLAVRKGKGDCFHVYGKEVALVPVLDFKMADGSGRDFAISAMAFGKSAIQSVRFASRFNMDTSSDVDYVIPGRRRARVERAT